MKDIDTGEELVFPCKRWLSRDEDDHEICRELPVIRRGEPTLPGTSLSKIFSSVIFSCFT